jgi:hypothetical protein
MFEPDKVFIFGSLGRNQNFLKIGRLADWVAEIEMRYALK